MKKPRELPYQALYVFTASDDNARRTEIAHATNLLNQRVTGPELSPGKAFTDQYLELVAKAQAAADAGKWGDAYSLIWNATFLVNRAIETVNKRSARWWLTITPVFTFALIIFCDWILGKFKVGSMNVDAKDLEIYFRYLWAGAIGGTTIAYWGIVKHTILMDFDDQYELWYYFKPLLGAIFGLISVIIIKAGFISLQTVATPAKIENQLPLYIIAFIAGFSERFFVQLIDRVTTALFGGETPNQPATTPTPSQVQQNTPVGTPSPSTLAEGTEPEHPGLP